ncbi:uncharacterized protein DFL_005811 [Arthrobotrys flagrans]|uniref:Uncharacterized protein n=1 Tax=Arthrobotrys flagrans TaxID=97331 RepID=A0A436ZZ41_ARTFL|nr:hypothetical protein DFL_005811 [Arthrobotrys flagrans]
MKPNKSLRSHQRQRSNDLKQRTNSAELNTTDSACNSNQTPLPIRSILTEVSGNPQTLYRGPRRPIGLPLQTTLKVCGDNQTDDEKAKEENINPANPDGGVDIEEFIRRLTGG